MGAAGANAAAVESLGAMRTVHANTGELGEFAFESGETYVGDWAANKKDGFGTKTWTKGHKYEGEWAAGKRQGKGSYWSKAEGSGRIRKQYAGDWVEDKLAHFAPAGELRGNYKYSNKPSGLYHWLTTARPPAFRDWSNGVVALLDPDQFMLRPITAAAAAGLGSNAVMWASLYSVATTGGGLPAGPFGVVGLVEGVSYLLVVGLAGAALYGKVSTGSGLPFLSEARGERPGGLLGAAEGLSCLSVAAGAAVLLLLQANQGCVPNALPLADYSDRVAVCR